MEITHGVSRCAFRITSLGVRQAKQIGGVWAKSPRTRAESGQRAQRHGQRVGKEPKDTGSEWAKRPH